MQAIIDFIESFSKKLGISPAILFIPFSKIAIFEIIALQIVNNKGAKELVMITPVIATLMYFAIYFITTKIPTLRPIGMINEDESAKYFQTISYSVLCFVISAFITMIILNNKYSLEDKMLYHTASNRGIALAQIDYVNLSEKLLDKNTISNILNTGFIEPFNEISEKYYSNSSKPSLVLLPHPVPTQIKINEIFNIIKTDYPKWAKEHKYDIAVYGEAEQGESENIFLKLDFKIFDEPKTIESGKSMFKMYYTVSNYDSDVLLASFDNMVKEIGGITLYLDEKYNESKNILSSVINSLSNEIKDYSEDKAKNEVERKSFEKKRDKLKNNLGIVYFYLGNTSLLSGNESEAEIAYNKSKELLSIKTTAKSGINSWIELISQVFTAHAASNLEIESLINNLSIAYAKNGKLDKAEEILANSGAEESDNVLLSQNLGIIYLEQGIKEINGDEVKKDNQKIQKALKLFEKSEQKLKEKIDEEENSIVLKNNYHNQGILSIVNEDFEKAEEFFGKEMEITEKRENIKNKQQEEKKQILKEQVLNNSKINEPINQETHELVNSIGNEKEIINQVIQNLKKFEETKNNYNQEEILRNMGILNKIKNDINNINNQLNTQDINTVIPQITSDEIQKIIPKTQIIPVPVINRTPEPTPTNIVKQPEPVKTQITPVPLINKTPEPTPNIETTEKAAAEKEARRELLIKKQEQASETKPTTTTTTTPNTTTPTKEDALANVRELFKKQQQERMGTTDERL